jgi:two-component system LytT family sensor kinase
MKKIIKSLLTAFIIYGIIIIVSFLISLTINNFEEGDFFRVYVTSFFVFFTPIFLSILFFEKDKSLLFYLKTPTVSLIIVYIIIFFYFNYMKFRDSYSFFELSTLMNSLMSFFTALFVSFILVIKSYKVGKSNVLKNKINYSFKILLLIPVSGAIIYTILILIGSSSFFNAITVWGNVLSFGIILSFLSFHFFKFLYSNYNNIKRKIFIIIYYFLITILFIILFNISVIVLSLKNINSEFIYRSLMSSIVLFTPFYLYIIALTHLYFLKLLSKVEKEELKQQSLESQLNYQQLKNQLSPHFLFNNINVLTSLIEENPTKAVTFSENLSHIYRYFLEQEKQDVVLVKDEIEFARSYLELLQDRFEVGLNFIIIIDEKVGEKHIVSTILQQVLENVVKHNTINEINIIDVKITSEENYLIIENNKNPKLQTASESKKGIENIKKRIAFFTDEKVIVEDAETYFLIKLPILETV